MTIALRFLGAADTVTGSSTLLETPHGNVLIDCGAFQGAQADEDRNRTLEGVDLDALDAVLITHAHLDHVGRLPLLARDNWDGPVFATEPTRDLARVVLVDSAGIAEENARRALRRKNEGKRYDEIDLRPAFGMPDALDILESFQHGIGYDQPLEVVPGITATFRDAGHILGSAFVEIAVTRPHADPFRITFSGDLGNAGKPIVRNPRNPAPCDAVVLETTYANRDHREFDASVAEFREVIERAIIDRGAILIPSFALERTQELLFVLHAMKRDGVIDNVPVFLDSPMAIDATRVFTRHRDYFDREALQLEKAGENPFRWPGLEYIRSPEESRQLNEIDGPVIIIASSGMCNGGRIVHHLRHRLDRPSTHVVFLGYQARGTLGRRLVDRHPIVRMFGQEIEVRAEVHTIGGFSAHAGRRALLDWYEATGPAPTIFLNHGEDETITGFAQTLRNRYRTQVHDPKHLQRIVLAD